ncbi:hypothetical protein HDU98_003622, partial [Podochytrium sp. JEL0797]
TPLHRSSAKGSTPLVKLLLAQPTIKLDIEDMDGNTALHAAIENGHAEIAVLLVEAGAELDVENKDKKKPLDLAPENVKSYLVRALQKQ